MSLLFVVCVRGTYYLNHLQYIKLNEKFVPFSKRDLSYLLKENYDVDFVRKVYSTRVVGSVQDLVALTQPQPQPHDPSQPPQPPQDFRLSYRTKSDFRKIALQLEIMEDLKVPPFPLFLYFSISSYSSLLSI